jgi:hypothetical protein
MIFIAYPQNIGYQRPPFSQSFQVEQDVCLIQLRRQALPSIAGKPPQFFGASDVSQGYWVILLFGQEAGNPVVGFGEISSVAEPLQYGEQC